MSIDDAWPTALVFLLFVFVVPQFGILPAMWILGALWNFLKSKAGSKDDDLEEADEPEEEYEY